ncbi:MAG: CHAT domain-containing protein, partial [Phormidesmis sp. CAN_BIN44]|nr:CHAT domain-containing protein [Phormidesmis sp. CAN_BIN44]
GRYSDAEPFYQQALSIYKTALGEKHPNVATSLNNLAALYSDQGRYRDAEPFYQQALSIRKAVLGEKHPDVAQSLNNLAALYSAQGDLPHAADSLEQGLNVQETNLIGNLAFGSERQKQDYIKTVSGTTDASISLAFESKSSLLKADRLALTTALRRKGRVLDAVSVSTQILLGQKATDPAVQKLYNEWRSVLQQQSNLVYRGLGDQAPEQYKATLEQLEIEQDRLESALSRVSSEFSQEIKPVELASVQQQIPKDAALIEIVQYFPYNPKAKQSDRWGKPRYAAAILRSTGDPIWKDLGEVAAINKAAQEFREALKNPDSTINPSAQALEKLLITPLRPHLGNARHLLISPDGQLSLIPFEALRNHGKYLIQEYDISYLTSGRDLLRFPNFVASQNQPALFADINYTDAEIVQPIALKPGTRGSENPESIDLATLKFKQLSYTKAEAEAIQSLFGFQLFTDRKATETALKQLPTPSILHLSTHAFFLPDQENQPKPALGEISSTSAISPQPFKSANPKNPLLRSGIALAGFNERMKPRSMFDDGVLTALEVAALNLHGTQLVVLSACETGLGDIKIGEGVYGLRRALVIAGSESQVLSLWRVEDQASQILLTHYYQKLKAGKGRHEALKLAQLDLLNDKNYNGDYSHPYYWSAFLFSGNWKPLVSK